MKIFFIQRHYSKDEIHEVGENYHIELAYEQTGIMEGWVGCPKGMFQVLWERGWIPLSYHTINKHVQYCTILINCQTKISTVEATKIRYRTCTHDWISSNAYNPHVSSCFHSLFLRNIQFLCIHLS